MGALYFSFFSGGKLFACPLLIEKANRSFLLTRGLPMLFPVSNVNVAGSELQCRAKTVNRINGEKIGHVESGECVYISY